MLELYGPALVFAPILLYTTIGTLLFSTGYFTFNKGMALLGVSFVVHVALSVLTGNWLGLIVQTVVALIAFALMIVFFAGKTSGETILTMTALLGLTPIPSGLLAIVGSLVAFLVYAIVKLKKSEVFSTMYTAVVSSGMAQQLPNYEHMGSRKELSSDEKRVSLIPFMLVIYLGFALFFLARPLFMDM